MGTARLWSLKRVRIHSVCIWGVPTSMWKVSHKEPGVSYHPSCALLLLCSSQVTSLIQQSCKMDPSVLSSSLQLHSKTLAGAVYGVDLVAGSLSNDNVRWWSLRDPEPRKTVHTVFFEPYKLSKGQDQASINYIQHIYSYSTLSNGPKVQHCQGNKFANVIDTHQWSLYNPSGNDVMLVNYVHSQSEQVLMDMIQWC